MKITTLCIGQREDSYMGKRGQVTMQILALLDTDSTHALINTFDLVLTDEDSKKFGGKLVGKKVEVGVYQFEPAFGGRLRAKGAILAVGGEKL
jgi:hypothetical protein